MPGNYTSNPINPPSPPTHYHHVHPHPDPQIRRLHPLVTFFHADETLDIPSTLKHAKRMAEGGVAGLVLQGSNGEAPHLDHTERQTLVRSIRTHLNELGYKEIQLIVGCGAPSVRETLVHITEAKESGADFALVLPPSYWVAATNVAVIEGFLYDVATSSPLPILIYNFPGVTGGIDISSLASSALSPTSFSAFGGKSDFFLSALVAGSHGIIAALANIVPKLHVQMLYLYKGGDLSGAQALQAKLSHADWALSKVGVAGVKAIISHHFGYGTGRGRRPLGNTTFEALSEDILAPIREMVELEVKA
ncbi:hypothetical protein BDV12DRAFT_196059 [Aspergillus spectabilis]